MGRPIHKKYFANTNLQYFGVANVGGEGLASVALGTAGSGYSQGLTATVDAPSLTNGQTATVSVAVNPATGAITGYTVTSAGSGYTSAPAVTLVPATTVTRAGTGNDTETTITLSSTTGLYVGMQVTGSAGLGTGNGANSVLISSVDSSTQITVATAHDGAVSGTLTFTDIGASGVPGTRALTSGAAARQNSIKCEAQIGSGGSEVLVGDILKQVGSRRYKVQTSDGTAVCSLVTTNALGANEMSIMATDSAGGTYLVSKLTSRRAVLVPVANTHGGTTSAGTAFASGTSAPWTFSSATSGVVQISSH